MSEGNPEKVGKISTITCYDCGKEMEMMAFCKGCGKIRHEKEEKERSTL